jgi:hypothetical protein
MHVSTAGQKRRLPDTMPENRRTSLRHATTAASTAQLLALEHATKLLGQFCGDSAPWTTQEKQDKLDNIALFVSVMSPEDQVVFCDDRFPTNISDDLISLEESLMLCMSLVQRGTHADAIRCAVRSIFLHPMFLGDADLSPTLVAKAAVFVYVADPSGEKFKSLMPFPLFCPYVLIGPIERVRVLAMQHFGMLAPHTTAKIAPHWNALTHMLVP